MHRAPDLVLLPDLARVAAEIPTEAPWFCEQVRSTIESALTPKQQEVVDLYYFQGWTEAEIAEHLGVTQQVVHKRLHGVRRGGRELGGALRRLGEALLPLAHTLGWVRR
jgi:RNA polymerase sigma factor (sigma-70 family)